MNIQENISLKLIETENKNKQEGRCLNLGCGLAYIKGYVNLDIQGKWNPDVIHNLNEYPYPFKDNEFDYVYASHILEHVDNLFRCLRELERVTKNKGIIHIRVPHFSSYLAYSNLEHKRFFGYATFEAIMLGEYAEEFNFKILETRLNVFSVVHPILNKILNIIPNAFPLFYEKFLYGRLPVNEVEIKLKVDKK